jgi:hypothetical protein
VPLGSVTVEPGEPGRLRFDGRCRLAADTAEGLARLGEVGAHPVFGPTGEPGVYRFASPELPPEFDTRSHVVVLKGNLQLPPDVALDVETGRGHLAAIDWRAPVRLHTGSGDLQVKGARADVVAFTGLGNCVVTDHRGGLEVEAGEGAILAFVDELGPGVRLATTTPSITVHLPADASFALDARVRRASDPRKASIRNSFDVPVEPAGEGHRCCGAVGSGGPPVVLQVGRGYVSVPKRPN